MRVPTMQVRSRMTATSGDQRMMQGRAPVQRRSRERVERILAAATDLIKRSGSEALKMSDLADRADVSIGSLYQYFPDKGAVIRTLAERYHEQGRACIEAGLAQASNPAAMRDAFSGLIDTYYAMFLAEPVLRDIWSGTQADKALQDVDLAATRVNGRILDAALRRVRPGIDTDELAASTLLVMHLGETTMRLAASLDRDEGARVVAAFRRMALAELFGA